ncbi:hypothetical protein KP79_PYT17589 [Mizuhopecten yessoensis]|uniref:Uncharacterized protein n=1 Tax=Mizuhopecten yessoensis TaxID=6573 RepID=A0A210QG77_MIZYE|nr:hypothetical protein KP79_PYT17589 [Mizuhopecten yessoensis]
MAGVDYCTVLPSWEFDKDPACVVSYLFDSIDGLSEASAADYVPPNNFMNSCLTLECASNDQLTGDSREPCTLSITSKPQYRVSVLGVDIISQSRLLEVYDTCEGYMMTSRGKRIPCLDAEGGENKSDMFNCRVRLKETLFGFTVKFPSTSNMKEFNIYNIVVILNPETGDEGNGEVAPTFNMGKVRSFVDTESMSPGAQQLMRSVEQFQQNKKSAVSGLQGMFSQSSSRSAGSSSGPGMMGLMGLMSMFSNMSSASQSGSRDTPTGSNSTQPSQIDSRDLPEANNNLAASQSNARNIPQAVNRTETTHLDARSNTQASNKPKVNQPSINSTVTSQMRGTPLQTDTATNTAASLHEALPSSLNLSELRNAVVGSSSLNSGVSAESEGGDMYQMLQNICGRVSQMRTVDPEENRLVMETGIEQRHSDIPQSRLEGDTGEAEGQSSQDETAGGHKLARDTLRTVVKSCMEEFELRLQTHIDNRLSQIEQKLEAKLDSILGVLQSVKGDNSPTPTERVTHIHAEGATHIQTEGASHLSTYGDTYKPQFTLK